MPVTYREVIEVYLWGSRNGFTQEQIDGIELWVLAEMLRPGEPAEGDDGTVELTPEEFQARSQAEAVARYHRLAAAQAATVTAEIV